MIKPYYKTNYNEIKVSEIKYRFITIIVNS